MKAEQNWALRERAKPGDAVSMTGRGAVRYEEHPWDLFQAVADAPGLVMSMVPGLVSGLSASTLNPTNGVIEFTPATVTDDDVTLFWVKVSLELVAYGDVFKVWAISAAVVEKGASVPADTLNVSTNTDGDVHVLIGSVTAASGAVTVITQALFSPLEYKLPTVLTGPAEGVHVLVSTDGVLAWAETAEWTCPEPP